MAMIGKIVCLVGLATLLHYRHMPAVNAFITFGLDFLRYLASWACRAAGAMLHIGKPVCKFIFRMTPYIVSWAKTSVSVIQWFCQQVAYGLLGWTNTWKAVLSWVFMLSALFLYLSNKIRNRQSQRFVRTAQDLLNVEVRNQNNRGGANWEPHHRPRVDIPPHNMGRPNTPNRNEREDSDSTSEEEDEVDHRNDLVEPQMESRGNLEQRNRPEERGDPVQEDASVALRRIEANLEARNCVVCFLKEKNAALFPCGHAQLCRDCADLVFRTSNKCPLCQSRIWEIRTVYI